MIEKAINSVLDQTYKNWELIIINDASNDNTDEIVASYSDERIVYIKNEKNLERSASRNKGIDIADGDFICFLDSDDYYLENHLEEFEKCIKFNNYQKGLYYCEIIINKELEFEKIKSNNKKSYKNNIEFVFSDIIGVPRTCIERSIFNENKFNESLRISEDVELWMRILKKHPLINNLNHSYVINEHEARTVNETNFNAYNDYYLLMDKLIKENKVFLSKETINFEYSRCFFYFAQYYKNKSFIKSIFYLIKSIYIAPNYKTKEKIYFIYKLII